MDTDDKNHEFIWVFLGEGHNITSGVFSSHDLAKEWISANKLSGMLTAYPLDIPVYQFALDNKWFTPRYPSQSSSKFIGNFSSAYLEHYHYKNGTT